MRTWIWPFNWYVRIRELEAKVAELDARNRKLDAALRIAAIQQASLISAYSASMASVAAMVTRS